MPYKKQTGPYSTYRHGVVGGPEERALTFKVQNEIWLSVKINEHREGEFGSGEQRGLWETRLGEGRTSRWRAPFLHRDMQKTCMWESGGRTPSQLHGYFQSAFLHGQYFLHDLFIHDWHGEWKLLFCTCLLDIVCRDTSHNCGYKTEGLFFVPYGPHLDRKNMGQFFLWRLFLLNFMLWEFWDKKAEIGLNWVHAVILKNLLSTYEIMVPLWYESVLVVCLVKCSSAVLKKCHLISSATRIRFQSAGFLAYVVSAENCLLICIIMNTALSTSTCQGNRVFLVLFQHETSTKLKAKKTRIFVSFSMQYNVFRILVGIFSGGDDLQQLLEAHEEEFLEIMALVGMANKPLHVRRMQKTLQVVFRRGRLRYRMPSEA